MVIRAIGEMLLEMTRMTDTCFRYGGDEFAVMLGCADLSAARLVAEKIRQLLKDTPVPVDNGFIGSIIGVACYSETDFHLTAHQSG